MRKPAKWEIREFAKLADMIGFLKEKYRPFTAIAREAVRRGMIRRSEVDKLYQCFAVCVRSIGMFEREFFPYDKTLNGRDRWAWTLPEDMTRERFLKKINNHVKKNFKTPLDSH